MMQEERVYSLFKKIKEYEKNSNLLLELEAVDLVGKHQLTCGGFQIPMEVLKDSYITRRNYAECSVLEIKNKMGKTIGMRLDTDNHEFYQITFLEENNTSFIEYCIETNEESSFVRIENNNIFSYDTTSSHDNKLENIVTQIDQKIENLLGNDHMKIYQIRRKGLS